MPKKKKSKRALKVRDLKTKKDTKGGIMAEWSRTDLSLTKQGAGTIKP